MFISILVVIDSVGTLILDFRPAEPGDGKLLWCKLPCWGCCVTTVPVNQRTLLNHDSEFLSSPVASCSSYLSCENPLNPVSFRCLPRAVLMGSHPQTVLSSHLSRNCLFRFLARTASQRVNTRSLTGSQHLTRSSFKD